MGTDDARRLILSRRARFVAAALASAGVVAAGCDDTATEPQPCLSVQGGMPTGTQTGSGVGGEGGGPQTPGGAGGEAGSGGAESGGGGAAMGGSSGAGG